MTAPAPALEGRGSPPTERVIRIMSFLAVHPTRSYSLSELARAAGISTATCHAILASLTHAGWVTRTDRTYRLGPRMLAISRAAATGYPVAQAAARELPALAETTGMPVTSAVLGGHIITVVDAAGPGAAGLTGRAVPYVPPIGMVFAAWGDAEAWLRRSPEPHPHETQHLRRAIRETRERGYVIERFTPAFARLRGVLAELAEDDRLQEEVLALLARLGYAEYFPPTPLDRVDVTVLGVPVFDTQGNVAANLSLHPGRDLSRTDLTALTTPLLAAAARATARITV